MHLLSLRTLALVFQIGLLPFFAHAQTAIERIAASPETEIERAPTIPAAVEEAIHAAAKKSQPNDYQMQRFVANKELWAYQMLRSSPSWEGAPKDVLEGILATAKKAHPDNYATQLYVVEQELSAYRRLLHFQPPAGVPSPVLKGIAETALQRFANQYSAQLNFVQNQITAFGETERGQSLNVRPQLQQPLAKDERQSRTSRSVPKLIDILEGAGLNVEMKWHKSKYDGKWLSQARCYFTSGSERPIGLKELLRSSNTVENTNELNCELLGDSSGRLAAISIEAEIVNPDIDRSTLRYSADLIAKLLPDCPEQVVEAFTSGKQLQVNNWSVSRDDHNAGTDMKLQYKFE